MACFLGSTQKPYRGNGRQSRFDYCRCMVEHLYYRSFSDLWSFQLKRSGPLKRVPFKKNQQKALPVRSEKRKKQMIERAPIWETVLKEQGPVCAWPKCNDRWDDLHEVHTRARGGSITDRTCIIGLCRRHNGEATDTRPAECIGVVIPSWAGNSDLQTAMDQAAALRQGVESGNPMPCPWQRGETCTSPVPKQKERCEEARSDSRNV